MAAFLLLDGDRNFRRALEIALRLEGAEVAATGSPGEAAALLATRPFDTAVVDTLLPDADAILDALCGGRARVIAVGPHRELLERAARRHGVATLEKPFSAEALLAGAARARPGAAA